MCSVPVTPGGTGGPLRISYRCARDPPERSSIAARIQMGLRRKTDLNKLDQEGIGYFPATIKHGRRVSSAAAFLAPVKGRANLALTTDTTATKIIFDGSRAVGVRSLQHGVAREFLCGKEIVLCAGALQSPKLLQLSGIGPAELLRVLGVLVVCDSPGVGMNLVTIGISGRNTDAYGVRVTTIASAVFSAMSLSLSGDG